jgi:hypothetical protein
MDRMPVELVALALGRVGHLYQPAWACVCRLWRGLVPGREATAWRPVCRAKAVAAWIERGHIGLVRWALAQGWLAGTSPEEQSVFARAAVGLRSKAGDGLVRLLVEHGSLEPSADLGCVVARFGRRRLLGWLREERGCFVDDQTLCAAIESGDMDLVRWLGDAQQCDVHAYACEVAARAGRMDILDWAYTCHHVPMTLFIAAGALRAGHTAAFDWISDRIAPQQRDLTTTAGVFVLDAAASAGRVDILERASASGVEWRSAYASTAIASGRRDVLEWLASRGCPITADAFASACERGDLSLIEWLAERGCPSDLRSTRMACAHGNLAVLRWLDAAGRLRADSLASPRDDTKRAAVLDWVRERGFDLEPLVMTVGPKLGMGSHHRLVRWAVRNGVGLLGERVVTAAILIDRLDLVRWAVGRGYRIPAKALNMAIRLDRVHIARWLSDTGLCQVASIKGLKPNLKCYSIPMLSWLFARGDLDVDKQRHAAAMTGWLTGVCWMRAKANGQWHKSLNDCLVTAANVHVFNWAVAHGFEASARHFYMAA